MTSNSVTRTKQIVKSSVQPLCVFQDFWYWNMTQIKKSWGNLTWYFNDSDCDITVLFTGTWIPCNSQVLRRLQSHHSINFQSQPYQTQYLRIAPYLNYRLVFGVVSVRQLDPLQTVGPASSQLSYVPVSPFHRPQEVNWPFGCVWIPHQQLRLAFYFFFCFWVRNY